MDRGLWDSAWLQNLILTSLYNPSMSHPNKLLIFICSWWGSRCHIITQTLLISVALYVQPSAVNQLLHIHAESGLIYLLMYCFLLAEMMLLDQKQSGFLMVRFMFIYQFIFTRRHCFNKETNQTLTGLNQSVYCPLNCETDIKRRENFFIFFF